MVKGINFISALYTVGDVSLPVTYRLVSKTESHIDKQGKMKRRSAVTKNEHFRAMLQNCLHNRIPFRYVLNDILFTSAENMSYINASWAKSSSWRSRPIAKLRLANKTNSMVAITDWTNSTCPKTQ